VCSSTPLLENASVAEWTGFGHSALGLFGIAVLVLAVRAVRSTPALTWVAIVLGLPVVVLTIVEGFVPDNQQVTLWSSGLHALFYRYTAYGLLRYMFNDNWVTRDELYATGATFTVVAWAFAYLYSVVQILRPNSFSAGSGADQPRTWFELLFLSFTTLTSVGLSDIGPIRPHARSISMIEQLVGVNVRRARHLPPRRAHHRPVQAVGSPGTPSSSANVASDGPRRAPMSRATASTSRMTLRVLPPASRARSSSDQPRPASASKSRG